MEYIAHSSCQQQLEQKGGFCESSSRRDFSLVVSIELDVANFRASVESEIIELCWIANSRGTRSDATPAPAANPDCMQNCLKFNKTGGGLHRAETDGLPA